jgi:5-methylcytosine-specific restriction endonuclease McrA
MKRCSKCAEVKAASEFYFDRRDGRPMARCKRCVIAAGIEYRRRSPKARARQRAYKAARRPQYREYNRAYVKRNPEVPRENSRRWRLANPAKHRAAVDAWQRAHPDAGRVAASRHRSRVAGSVGKYTARDLTRIFLDQGGLCHYCDTPLGEKFHADHKQPVSRGGSNWPGNIACACASCNQHKGAKTEAEFFALLRAA